MSIHAIIAIYVIDDVAALLTGIYLTDWLQICKKKIFCHSVQSSDEYAGQVGFRCMFNILHAQIRQTKAAKSIPQFLNFLLC